MFRLSPLFACVLFSSCSFRTIVDRGCGKSNDDEKTIIVMYDSEENKYQEMW